MKTIITSEGNILQSKFDLRFGRAAWFCVYDTTQETIEFIENANKNRNGGAGTKSVEEMANLEANQVISGDFGPKAKSLLERLKIKMIVLEEKNITIQEIIERISDIQS